MRAAEEEEMASATIPAPPKKRRFLRFVKRVLLGVVLLLVCALLAGAAYQAVANWKDARRFLQEGRSIALGAEFPGVMLNLNCVGQGTPTGILDSGLGVPAAGWDLVLPEVAKFARVCSYDRAGHGWSSAGPMPRTSEQIAKELHALLAASGERGPYVLVAHSFGGYNVRVYTSKYPADVAGLALVDTSHEDQNQLIDRKSTRLNSSHRCTSYAVLCMKKKSGSRIIAPNIAAARQNLSKIQDCTFSLCKHRS